MKDLTITLFNLAKNAHGNQMYGDDPYMYHIQMVREKVRHLWYTQNIHDNLRTCLLDQLAILHDVVEDTKVTLEDIHNVLRYECHDCPITFINALDAITKRDGESREDYIKRCCEDELAHKVKIADTLANLECSVRDGNVKRIVKYTDQLKVLHLMGSNTAK